MSARISHDWVILPAWFSNWSITNFNQPNFLISICQEILIQACYEKIAKVSWLNFNMYFI